MKTKDLEIMEAPLRSQNEQPGHQNGHHGFYDKYILPRLIHFVCGLSPMMRQRRKIVPQATGRVLEIGIGSGLNLSFYNPDQVDAVWGLDPSPQMLSLAGKAKKKVGFDVTFLESGAEMIPLDDRSADTVLITYVLCTIPNLDAALKEIRRVLKTGGRLLFCEHGAAPDDSVLRWQNRLNPVWQKVGGGCHLNRRIPGLLTGSGFAIKEMTSGYIPGWKPASYNYLGTAVSR